MKYIYRLLNSLIFKIGIIIILVEVLVLTIVGLIYINRFSDQVNRRIISQVQIPGKLMRTELLSYNSVENRETIQELVGEDIIEALVIGLSTNIFFSPDPSDLGQNISTIPDIDTSLFDINNPQEQVIFEGVNIVSITPIFNSNSESLRLFLYIKTGTGEAESEKTAILYLFLLGSIATVFFTSLIIMLSFRFTFLARINALLTVLGHIKSGDLTARTKGIISEDEIGVLQRYVNSMVIQLESTFENLEKRVEERTIELADANDEIRNFVYIVSHDLRAPLVNIKGFTQELSTSLKELEALLKDKAPELNEDSELNYLLKTDIVESLEFIDSSANRIKLFVDSILRLSRLGRQVISPEILKPNDLIQENLKSLKYRILEKNVKITVNLLPELVADRVMVEQIFGNILGNAVNYLDGGRLGEIEINGHRNAEFTQFSIHDNGRGIAKHDFEKVFVPLRRIGEKTVEGEGMGLAFVQTLIRRHGGRIWFESELGVGTTFYFTIPNELS